MTATHTPVRKKAGAVFFASIMVLSMVAIGFAGTAAATDPEPINADYYDIDGSTVDVVFQGQDVYLIEDDGGFGDNDGETVNLRQVDSFDAGAVESSSQVEQLQVEKLIDIFGVDSAADLPSGIEGVDDVDDDTLAVEIGTGDLDAGDYFVRGVDGLETRPLEEDTFEVTIQSFDVEFDDDVVTDGGPDSATDLDIDSDRGQYSVNVSADGDLDEEELLEVLVNQQFADGAVVDLHLTDTVRSAIVFDDADRPRVNIEPLLETPDPTLISFADATQEELDELGTPDEAVAGVPSESDSRPPLQVLINVALEQDGDLVDQFDDAGLGSDAASVADSLAEDDFEAFLDENPFVAFAFNEAEDDADETVVLIDIRDREEEVDFTDIDDGAYEFAFEVSDTEAAATASITVNEEDQDGAFSQGVYTTPAGDIVEITLEIEETDEAFIQIGDEDAGFVDVIIVEDDGGTDGEVTFQVNTRTLGAPNTDIDDVYHSEDDEILASAVHSTPSDFADAADDVGVDAVFVDDDGDEFAVGGQTSPFTAYLEELDLLDDVDQAADEQLTRPLQPTSYELTAGIDDNGEGVFEADDGESSATNELDSALLELERPGLGAVITHVAPSDSADEDDELDDLLDVVTTREDVAIEDRLVVQFEATGIFGAFVDFSDDGFDVLEDGTAAAPLDAIIENDGEGIDVVIEAEDAIGNQDPTKVNFDNDDEDEIFIILDNDGGQFFVIVDTDEDDAFSNGDPDDGDVFEATIEYETDDDDRYEFSDTRDGAFDGSADGDTGDAAYPFLPADSDISATTTFTFEDAAAAFDNLSEDGDVQVVPEEEAVVSGETNIAPGTDASVRLRSTGDTSPSFVVTEDATIESDGAFASTFDFSGQAEGDTANAIFRADGDQIETQSAVFVDAVEEVEDTPTPTPEEEDTPTPEEEEDTPTPEEDTPTPDEDTPEDTEDDTPGFGAVVALVALVAAALLATRRRSN